MKIAIVTFVRAYNYGAVLQAYALNRVISEMGMECKVIDYYPNEFYKEYHLSGYGSIKYKITKRIKKWYRKNIPFIRVKIRCNRFDGFITKSITLTKKQFCKFEELKECEVFDGYISGSDQVWCPYLCGFDKTFFLMFCDKKKRYSYAASFGLDSIPDGFRHELKNRLNDWSMYSVRESSGIDLLKDLTGKDAVCCCDPTLLMPLEKWTLLSKNIHKESYILLYFVKESLYLFESAKKLFKKYNFKVICLHSNMQPKYFSDEFYSNYGFVNKSTCSPYEFISLFRDAKYILTNSFHGTVFSIIFHKCFLCQTESEDGVINNRVTQLMDSLGLRQRSLTEDSIFNINNTIKWEDVDIKLEKLRAAGMDYLRKVISDIGR